MALPLLYRIADDGQSLMVIEELRRIGAAAPDALGSVAHLHGGHGPCSEHGFRGIRIDLQFRVLVAGGHGALVGLEGRPRVRPGVNQV